MQELFDICEEKERVILVAVQRESDDDTERRVVHGERHPEESGGSRVFDIAGGRDGGRREREAQGRRPPDFLSGGLCQASSKG